MRLEEAVKNAMEKLRTHEVVYLVRGAYSATPTAYRIYREDTEIRIALKDLKEKGWGLYYGGKGDEL